MPIHGPEQHAESPKEEVKNQAHENTDTIGKDDKASEHTHADLNAVMDSADHGHGGGPKRKLDHGHGWVHSGTHVEAGVGVVGDKEGLAATAGGHVSYTGKSGRWIEWGGHVEQNITPQNHAKQDNEHHDVEDSHGVEDNHEQVVDHWVDEAKSYDDAEHHDHSWPHMAATVGARYSKQVGEDTEVTGRWGLAIDNTGEVTPYLGAEATREIRPGTELTGQATMMTNVPTKKPTMEELRNAVINGTMFDVNVGVTKNLRTDSHGRTTNLTGSVGYNSQTGGRGEVVVTQTF